MQATHDHVLAGHLGVAKTYEVIIIIIKDYYRLNMFHDIQHYYHF